ncbi:MAG TPA: adenylate/guanylate cyclase domain-containing protein [Roseiarcus sp.]|nr:adenylate/guanylate cyclase domain-containing protein [Roseiarcus sp.]
MAETRKLAAILAADVVGYSRLMGEDEAGTVKLVRDRREAATPIVRAFGGRLVKTTGDGALLEFPSVVAAVECAIAIQKMMAERNEALPTAKRILYRVGVNLGDILIDGEDILGDGVNVAARLEGICEPGAVCLSGSAYEHVRGRIEAEFADLGERNLKNIAQPVRAYALSSEAVAAAKVETPEPAIEAPAPPPSPLKSRGVWARWPALAAALALALLAAGAYGWRAGYAPRFMAASVDDKLSNAPKLSIAVLPFENLSGDKEQDYFADGITDDLTTDLSHLEGSFVIARGTALTYKGKPIDPKQIGRELGVRYLLEGSVRRIGDKVAVNAQLISTDTGAQVWADRFEGDRGRLGDLQVELVARLASSLGVELVKAESLRAMRERPENPDAGDLVMHGETILQSKLSMESVNDAIGLFERALVLDPQNARAMRDLAVSLTRRINRTRWSKDLSSDIARAEKLIDDALALQRDDSESHRVKGMVLAAKRQWGSAIAEAELAIALDHNNAKAHADASFWKMYVGHSEDGFEGIETAFRLSPRDSAASTWQHFFCELRTHLAQWDAAIDSCNKAFAGNPDNWRALVNLAAANAWAGHDKEAQEAVVKLRKLYPNFTVQSWAGIHWSDDPTFNAQYARIVEGLRKAGLPGGDKKTD